MNASVTAESIPIKKRERRSAGLNKFCIEIIATSFIGSASLGVGRALSVSAFFDLRTLDREKTAAFQN